MKWWSCPPSLPSRRCAGGAGWWVEVAWRDHPTPPHPTPHNNNNNWAERMNVGSGTTDPQPHPYSHSTPNKHSRRHQTSRELLDLLPPPHRVKDGAIPQRAPSGGERTQSPPSRTQRKQNFFTHERFCEVRSVEEVGGFGEQNKSQGDN